MIPSSVPDGELFRLFDQIELDVSTKRATGSLDYQKAKCPGIVNAAGSLEGDFAVNIVLK